MYEGLSTPCVQESFYFLAVYPDRLHPLWQPPVVGHQEATLCLLQLHPVISLVMVSLATPIALGGILSSLYFTSYPLLLFLHPSLCSWVYLLCPKLGLPLLSRVGLCLPPHWSGLVNSVGSRSGFEVPIYLITASFSSLYMFGFSCLIWFSSQRGSLCNISSSNNVSSADPLLACTHFLYACRRSQNHASGSPALNIVLNAFISVYFFRDMVGCQ